MQEGGEKEVEVDIPVYPGSLELQYIYIYICKGYKLGSMGAFRDSGAGAGTGAGLGNF